MPHLIIFMKIDDNFTMVDLRHIYNPEQDMFSKKFGAHARITFVNIGPFDSEIIEKIHQN